MFPKIDTKDISNIVKYLLAAIAIAVLIRFLVKNAKKINNKLKAGKQEKEEKAEAEKLGYSTTPKLGESMHRQIAEQLENAFNHGILGAGTDETNVYNAYGKIATGTPGDMIKVKSEFLQLTGDDLFIETRDELTNDELSNVRGILSNYPSNFRP